MGQIKNIKLHIVTDIKTMADKRVFAYQTKSSTITYSTNESIELPDQEVENFQKKYGDNKTHLHNVRDLEVQNLNIIGFGSFSVVKRGYSNKNKQHIAVKIVNLRDKRNKLYVKKYLLNEMKLWRELSQDNHKNLLNMKQQITTYSFSYAVTDYCVYGDLEKFIIRRSLDEAGARRPANDIVAGVKYCHSKGIAHRDIKPANILVADNVTLKLADFTFATKKNPICGNLCGTKAMLAPEQCTRKPYNPFVSDIWQLGITIYMILFRNLPYKKQKRKQILKEIQEMKHHHKGVPLPYNVSLECKDLLSAMLNLYPMSIYVVHQVLGSSWFVSVG